MSVPTKYPDWATDGNNVVEPPAGKVATGWLTSERPPAQWFNAWKALVGQWIRWLESRHNTTDANVTALGADAARKSTANTFTQPQTINIAGGHGISFGVPDANVPLIASPFIPQDHATTPPGINQWKLIDQYKRAGGAYVRTYVGADGTNVGGYAVVINAYWDANTQLWNRENSTKASTALVIRETKIAVLRKDQNAGVLTWTTAQWGQGGLDIYEITTGVLSAAFDISLGGEVLHPTRKPRTVPIPLHDAIALTGLPNTVGFTSTQITVEPNGAISLPIRPPHDSRLGVCRMKISGPDPTKYTLTGYRMPNNMADTALPVAVPYGGTLATHAGGVFTVQVDFGGYAVNTAGNSPEYYWLHFDNDASTASTVTILAADMSFTDPGPRNY